MEESLSAAGPWTRPAASWPRNLAIARQLNTGLRRQLMTALGRALRPALARRPASRLDLRLLPWFEPRLTPRLGPALAAQIVAWLELGLEPRLVTSVAADLAPVLSRSVTGGFTPPLPTFAALPTAGTVQTLDEPDVTPKPDVRAMNRHLRGLKTAVGCPAPVRPFHGPGAGL